jgi:riboflavin kinase
LKRVQQARDESKMVKETKTVRVKGRVFSGTGEGAKFIKLSWVKDQIREKMGFTPYEGTLNLRLDEEGKKVRKTLEEAVSVIILPENGYCRGKCFKARIMGSVDGAVMIPEVGGYPDDVLEVIAPINLRERFRLKDGDYVELSLAFK